MSWVHLIEGAFPDPSTRCSRLYPTPFEHGFNRRHEQQRDTASCFYLQPGPQDYRETRASGDASIASLPSMPRSTRPEVSNRSLGILQSAISNELVEPAPSLADWRIGELKSWQTKKHQSSPLRCWTDTAISSRPIPVWS